MDSGGSLRGCLLSFNSSYGGDDDGQLAMTLDAAAATLGLLQHRARPSLRHFVGAPMFYVVTQVARRREAAFERVRAAQRATQRFGHAQAVQRQRLLQGLFQAARRRHAQLREVLDQLLQCGSCVVVALQAPRRTQTLTHRRVVFRRQMSQHVSLLVHLTALHHRAAAERRLDRLAQRRRSVQHEQ